jgi:hypothetical protein
MRGRRDGNEPVTRTNLVQQFRQKNWILGNKKMRRQLRRAAGVVAVMLFTATVTLNTTVVRKHHHRLEEEHQLGAKELVLGKNSNSESSFGDKLTELDVFSEMIASGTDDLGLREVPALTRNVHDNHIEREEIPNSSAVIPESALKALFVFTMVREDLLDLHLLSIDFPVEQVFVIQNVAKPDAVDVFQRVLNRYRGCKGGIQEESCVNPNIRNFVVLSNEENLGYAGSFNTGIKAMLEHNFIHAIFSGDDTRFVPGRLKAAKQILENENACMYHFEGYSSFGITLTAVKLIGPMDENFWPAYCEDCDYWYRAQLAGCRVFYRGGYVPEVSTPDSKSNSFMEHGDVKHESGSGSSTLRSDPLVNKLVANTLHPSRGRFAYLKRKWGFDTCGLYHKVLNQWRGQDEILNATNYSELVKHGAKWALPYNDSQIDIKHWIPEDSRSSGAVSSRAVNSLWAPMLFVWQELDYAKLQVL